MKKLVPPLLALLLAATGCAARYGENWRPVSEAGVKAMFPGEPSKQKEGSGTVYSLGRGGEAYVLTYELGGLQLPDPEQQLDQFRNGFVRSVAGGTLLGERSVTAGGVPGREVTVDVPQFGQEVVARLYVSKGIAYAAGVTKAKGKDLSDDARMFLDSVEVESR